MTDLPESLLTVSRRLIRAIERSGEACMCGEAPSIHRKGRDAKPGTPAKARNCPFAALIRAAETESCAVVVTPHAGEVIRVYVATEDEARKVAAMLVDGAGPRDGVCIDRVRGASDTSPATPRD